MNQTVLLPVEGKEKYKLGNLTEEQIQILKEDPNNIFKALAIGGGTFLAYETFQHLVNIPKEDWENMLPDELEKFLAPILHDNVDVEETISENETQQNSQDEMPDIDDSASAVAIDNDEQEHQNQNDVVDTDDNNDADEIDEHNDQHNDTVIIDDDNFDDDTNHYENIEIDDISDIMEEEGIDHTVVDDFVSDSDFSIDSEMMDYIHSDDILIDLNDSSADEIIINDDYIADSDISIDDFSFEDEDLQTSNYSDDYVDDYIDDYDEDDDSHYVDNDDSDYVDNTDYTDDSDDDEDDDNDHHLDDDHNDYDDTDDTL